MHVRGTVTGVGEQRTVTTQYGESDLAEVTLCPDGDGDGDGHGDGRGDGPDPRLTLWGDWAETAAVLEPGMEVAAYDVTRDDYQGRHGYATAAGTRVVVEPSFVVDVTDVRAWVQCPRIYYLNKLDGTDIAEPVVIGTIVHQLFGDLLRGRALAPAVEQRVTEAGLELGLLGADAERVRETVRDHAAAIKRWLEQGRLTDDDWRSEQLLISERYGLKGRADAVRQGAPVELKTGKNTQQDPRFKDKVQAACYALVLGEHRATTPDTGTLLYTKNAALDRSTDGDLAPAKEFSIGDGLLSYVLRARNELAAMEHTAGVPTGYEADAICEYCFEQDTCMAVAGRLGQESKAGQIGTAVPDDQQAYFDRLYAAVERERRAVHREYTKLWEQSAAERAAADRALVGLEPAGQRQRDTGRWELRADGRTGTSKIRVGDRVLASDGDPTGGNAELARVESLGDADADADADQPVVVTADEPVELRRLDVYPSTLSPDRLLTALHDAVLTRSPAWKQPLIGETASLAPPTFSSVERTFIENNDRQDEAVRTAVGAGEYALIHGPPGTGKTYTLARLVRALVADDERVLIAALTNRAVDTAVDTLLEQGLTDIVRLGPAGSVDDSLEPFRLDRAGEPDERAERLESASVVAATTASCGSRIAQTQSFDVAVVDEAGQLTEPGTLAAAVLADRLVLVGDHQQLPPVVRSGADANTTSESGAAAVADLSRSLFERLIDTHPEAAVRLTEQYRMSEEIQTFPSQAFYDGALRPATKAVRDRSPTTLSGVALTALPADLRGPVSFVDPDGTAQGNTTEAAAVADVVTAYREAGLDPDRIGVIAPYRAQVAEIGRRVGDEITVDTVDRFQGSSRAVIVVSFVATESLDSPIFDDYRRVNVALTRAKHAAVLVGDGETLRTDDTYRRMVEWADSETETETGAGADTDTA